MRRHREEGGGCYSSDIIIRVLKTLQDRGIQRGEQQRTEILHTRRRRELSVRRVKRGHADKRNLNQVQPEQSMAHVNYMDLCQFANILNLRPGVRLGLGVGEG